MKSGKMKVTISDTCTNVLKYFF